MAKFALLFVGGMVTDDKREQNTRDWDRWMSGLARHEKLLDGIPFGNEHKVVTAPGKVREYNWKNDSNVGGYCVVQTATMDEAVELCQDCPQLRGGYGSGTIEVREILETPDENTA